MAERRYYSASRRALAKCPPLSRSAVGGNSSPSIPRLLVWPGTAPFGASVFLESDAHAYPADCP